ncbi:hypothetical protein CQA53_11425 [Helicobacter didelphidarum]|uniref:Uncharacterized protein n=1 Tax=Helicobacter didelphidarum TaxID=2040648 RepID=A0A3D8I403_9HELI|nr:hypothetical protein [Helicobacter didelphidarum]RDU59484.1 hypothetical protein CQA53_11425 [Helicobacter didelphidarum]
MPLPLIPALLALGGGLLALGVIATLAGFFDAVDEMKKEMGAKDAIIAKKRKKGDYNVIDAGLRNSKGKTIISRSLEVSDDVARELRVGQVC